MQHLHVSQAYSKDALKVSLRDIPSQYGEKKLKKVSRDNQKDEGDSRTSPRILSYFNNEDNWGLQINTNRKMKGLRDSS